MVVSFIEMRKPGRGTDVHCKSAEGDIESSILQTGHCNSSDFIKHLSIQCSIEHVFRNAGYSEVPISMVGIHFS